MPGTADRHPPSPASQRRRARARPALDLADALPVRQAIPLVLVETMGLAAIFGVYFVLDALDSVLAPLLVPFAVSFVLIVASSAAPGARPLRVVGSYAIAALVGLGVSALPGPTFPEAVLAGAITMLAMHVSGALHSPAIAVAMIAVLADFPPRAALQALPLVLLLASGVVALAWLAHKVLGDAAYPARWW